MSKPFVETMVDCVEEAAGMLPYFKRTINGKRTPDSDLLEVAKDYYSVMAPVFRKAIRAIERARRLHLIEPW